jgi:hypothetical protein
MARQLRKVLRERGVTLPADPKEAGAYVYKMGKEVRRVIEDLIPGAKEAMDFLRAWAEILAGRGEPLQWTTPTGLPWANRYHKYKTNVFARYLAAFAFDRKLRTDMSGYQGEKVHGCGVCEFHSRAGRLAPGLDRERMFARRHDEHPGSP